MAYNISRGGQSSDRSKSFKDDKTKVGGEPQGTNIEGQGRNVGQSGMGQGGRNLGKDVNVDNPQLGQKGNLTGQKGNLGKTEMDYESKTEDKNIEEGDASFRGGETGGSEGGDDYRQDKNLKGRKTE